MTTNSLKTNQDIKAAFSGLFENRTEQERRDDAAQMISFRYLSEVDNLLTERGMTRRDLAVAVGTSASYITQLFRGDRLVNLSMLARFEEALSVKFTVEARQPAALPIEYAYTDRTLPTRPVRQAHGSTFFVSYSVNPDYERSTTLLDMLTGQQQVS